MTSCPSCGAAVRAGAERCPLCGTDLGTTEALGTKGLGPEARTAPDVRASAAPTDCPTCGHLNPAGARFCNACGATLAKARTSAVRAPAPPKSATVAEPAASADAGRRALLFVGGAVALVVALFAITSLSAGSDEAPLEPAPDVAGVAAAASVPDGPAPPLPDSLQRAADALEAQNTASGWYEAGRYYLTAGFDAQQSGAPGEAGVLWIRRALADFEKSLAIDENADVRYALAEASQFDPSDPMRATLEAQKVLQDDPNHVGGHYLMGTRRLQIGRVDSARVSFERVLALAAPADPFRTLAEQRLSEIAQAGTFDAPPTRGAPDGAGAPPPAGTPGPQ